MTQNADVIFNDREVAFREVATIGVMMRRGDLIETEGPGLELLRSIRKGQATRASLTNLLVNRYGVLAEFAASHSEEFINNLILAGIVSTSDGGVLPTSGLNKLTPINGVRCWQVARERHIPLKCKFDITYRCNIACKFCYNGERPGLPGPYPKESELTISEIEGVFEQLYESGTFVLTLSGGEPLARRDIDSILQLTDQFNFAVEILTNGTLVTERLAAILGSHRVQLVVVPLFGSCSDTHDSFVRQRGAFERACRGIVALRAAGVEVGVRCAITRANFDEWRTVRRLVESWGARYFPHVQIHLSSDRQIDLRDSLRLNDKSLAELFEGGLDLNPGYSCQVGFARVDVLPNGDVSLCSLLTEPLGNLRHQTFQEIWNHSSRLHELRSLLGDGVNGCNGCSVKADVAYRCSADALFDDGGLDRLSSEALRVLRIADVHSSSREGGRANGIEV